MNKHRENDFYPFPEHYLKLPPLIRDEKLNKLINDFNEHSFLPFVKQRDPEIPSDVVPLVGDYGAGKSHFAKRFIRDLKIISGMSEPTDEESKFTDHNYIVDKAKFSAHLKELGSTLEKPVPLLPVYVCCSRVWKEHEYISLSHIFDIVIKELIDSAEQLEKRDEANDDLTLPASAMDIIRLVYRKSRERGEVLTWSVVLKELLKEIGRLIIVVDEFEAILLRREFYRAFWDEVKSFITDSHNVYMLLCLPPEPARVLFETAALDRRIRMKRFEIGEFSVEITRKYVDSRKARWVFGDGKLISTCWELSQRGGGNFILLCRQAAIDATNEKRELNYNDIINGIKRCRDLKTAGGQNLFWVSKLEDAQAKLRKKPSYEEIFNLFVGELYPHTSDDLLSHGIDPNDFNTFLKDTFAGKLVCKHIRVEYPSGKDLDSQEELLKAIGYSQENGDYDPELKIKRGNLECSLVEILNMFPSHHDLPEFAFIPQSGEEFAKVVLSRRYLTKRSEPDVIDLREKLISYVKDKPYQDSEYYALSPSAKLMFVGAPIYIPPAFNFFKDNQEGREALKEVSGTIRQITTHRRRARDAVEGLYKALTRYISGYSISRDDETIKGLPGIRIKEIVRGQVFDVYVSVVLGNELGAIRKVYEQIKNDTFDSAVLVVERSVSPEEIRDLQGEVGLTDIEHNLIETKVFRSTDIEDLLYFYYADVDDESIINHDLLDGRYNVEIIGEDLQIKEPPEGIIQELKKDLFKCGLIVTPIKELKDENKMALFAVILSGGDPLSVEKEINNLNRLLGVITTLDEQSGYKPKTLAHQGVRDLLKPLDYEMGGCGLVYAYDFYLPKFVEKVYTAALGLPKKRSIKGSELWGMLRVLVGSDSDLKGWIQYFLCQEEFGILQGDYDLGYIVRIPPLSALIRDAEKEIRRLTRSRKYVKSNVGLEQFLVESARKEGIDFNVLANSSSNYLSAIKKMMKELGPGKGELLLEGGERASREIQLLILAKLIEKIKETIKSVVRAAIKERDYWLKELKTYEKETLKADGITRAGLTITLGQKEESR